LDRKIWFFANAGDGKNEDTGIKPTVNSRNNKKKKK
jgi:hypothetical protein